MSRTARLREPQLASQLHCLFRQSCPSKLQVNKNSVTVQRPPTRYWSTRFPLLLNCTTGQSNCPPKNAFQLVHGTGTGSSIWKLPILASQIRKHRATPAADMRQALIVLVRCENEKVKGGRSPFTSFSCDALAHSLHFAASGASLRNFAIVTSFSASSASLSLKPAHGKHGHFAPPADQRLEYTVPATSKLHCRAEGRSTENIPPSW